MRRRIERETEHTLDRIDDLRSAAERLRATARVVLVLDELRRTRRAGDPTCYASAALEALSRV